MKKTTLIKSINFTATFMVGLLLLTVISCSSFRKDDPFTNKAQAPQFISQLYSTNTQTVIISHPNGGHISWMGFIQSNNYKYFKIKKVRVGGVTVVSDGVEIDGETYTANSNAILQNITVPEGSDDGLGFANGSITASNSVLEVTVEYAPLLANEAIDAPHIGNLIINYDGPEKGSMRVTLEGFTQGIKEDKCTQAVSTMEAIEYKIVNNSIGFYFCASEVGQQGQANTSTDSSDPDYRGASTNYTDVNIGVENFTIYKVDEETVCLLSEPASIDPFDLPIPEGLAPITSMGVSIVEGSFSECSLDADGNIFCDQNVQIDALVTLSNFSLSNTGFTEEELVTDDCPDFGALSGSGVVGDSDLTLILQGSTLSDLNTEEYNIVDSLIAVEIPLTK